MIVVFNRLLLIAIICIDIAVVLYFFYWNRFIGYLLTLLFRFLYSSQGEASIWIEIGSIHFSILTGRILLKDIHYHSSNQTVRIVKGQVSWRYWIRDPASEEDFGHFNLNAGGEENKRKSRNQDCRIQVSFQGFEWFLYNRTPAYENIIAQLDPNANLSASRPSTPTTATDNQSIQAERGLPPILSFFPRTITTPIAIQRLLAWLRRQLPHLDPKDVLPIGIRVVKGAIICGNQGSTSLLVAEFAQADGRLGVTQSRSRYDLYKQIIAFKFNKPLIRLVQNEDHVECMTTTGEKIHTQMSTVPAPPEPAFLYSSFHKLWNRLKLYKRLFSRPRPHRQIPHLRNPKRSMDEHSHSPGADWEYAIERKIIEAPELELTYYTDVVGDVPDDSAAYRGSTTWDVGNGDVDPEWGVDLIVKDGILRYGPWADRQRTELQKIFFPSMYHDSQPTARLRPGDKRMWTHLQVFIELRGDTTLQIPFREASKNWLWDGAEVRYPRPRKRDPADIHLTVGDMSAITYTLPMVASAKGYESRLEVHLDNPVITSSLNDIRLVTAESCRIRGEMPAPLKWNAERQWVIAVSFRQPVLYLLRDHIHMFTDLAKDWISGPPSPFHSFIPMVYVFEMEMHHYELNLYVNDQNIIDKPLVRDENALLVLRGQRLKSQTLIPSNRYRPDSTNIEFSFDVPAVSSTLSLPRWHTHALFSPSGGHSIANIASCGISGSYLYYADIRDDNIEQMKLHINLRHAALHAIGWAIRYFMVMRENYLGSFTHFSTLYEYLSKRSEGLPTGDPLELKYRPGTSNALQVEMGLNVEHFQIVLPAGLPGLENSNCQRQGGSEVDLGACAVLDVPHLQLQFRMHEYYMEMTLNVDVIMGYVEEHHPHIAKHRAVVGRKEAVMMEGLAITANRLFGPQPRTATYLCIWEIQYDVIKALLSSKELMILSAVGDAFKLNFVDAPNIPAADFIPELDPDVTFLKVTVRSVEVTVRFDHVACAISLPAGVQFRSHDLAGDLYRKVMSVVVPEISTKMLVSAPQDPTSWLEAAHLSLDIYLDAYSSPLGWRKTARAQADFVAQEDFLTNRAANMFTDLKPHGRFPQPYRTLHRNGLYLPQPVCGRGSDRRAAQLAQPSPHAEAHPSSESEPEDAMTEAERDARVAQMRSLTPLPNRARVNEEENTSTGDESDDDGLEDEDSLDSAWSDAEGDAPASRMLSQYSRLTRRYAARFLHGPSVWDQGPFTLTHECRLWEYPDVDPQGVPLERTSSLVSRHNEDLAPDDTTSVTLIRLSSKKGLDARITPLILSSVEHIEQALGENTLSHELRLDAILSSHLSDFKGLNQPVVFKNTLFDVSVASIRIRAIQSGLRDMYPHTSEFLTSNVDTMLAQFLVKDIFLSGGMVEQEVGQVPIIEAGLSDVSLSFFAIPTAKHGRYSPFKKLPLNIRLSSLGLKMFEHSYDVDSSGISVEMDYLGPECALVVGLASARNARHLGSTLKKWKERSAAATVDLIRDVLQASEGRDIVDPLSIIQPLYLVQSGRPNELRTDTTFRFLFHLRHSLRTADTRVSRLPHQDLDTITPMIESRLVSLAMDNESSRVSTLSSIFPVFKKSTTNFRVLAYPLTKAISIRSENLSLTVFNNARTASSNFTLSSFHASSGVRTLDIVPYGPLKPMSFSQTSLHNIKGSLVQKIILTIALGDVVFTIVPDMLSFAQQLVRTQNTYAPSFKKKGASRGETTGSEDGKSIKKIAKAIAVDVYLALGQLKVEAVAETLVAVFGVAGLNTSCSAFSPTLRLSDASANATILVREVFLRAISVADRSQRRDGVFASLDVNDIKASMRTRRELAAVKVQSILGVGNLHLNVPKSALRLFKFIEDWRADFLPGIEAMIQALLSEMKDHNVPSPVTKKPAKKTPPLVQVHGRLSSLGMSLQVMRGTWLSWEAKDANLFMNSAEKTFGLKADYQIFSITSLSGTSSRQPHPRVKLALPSITVTCKQKVSSFYILTLVDFFHVKIKPSHWDALLTVQQKFGKDFNDLISLMEETRHKKSSSSTKPKTPPGATPSFTSVLKAKGFRAELEALSSVAILECDDIGGQFSSHTSQSGFFKLSDLSLSLASGTTVDTQDRRSRSAFVIIDLHADISNQDRIGYLVKVALTKMHAVMQPSSIGQIGDFVDHLQAEIWKRKEERASELAEFKEKTRSVMKTFRSEGSSAEPQEPMSILEKLIIDVRIEDVGVAFPLTLSQNLELPRMGSVDSTAVRAFLFSVASISFSSQLGESGAANMTGFSFQFVPSFSQSVPTDFSGENHSTNNRLLYPEMKAQVRLDRSGSTRKVQVDAKVTGFILDLDSTIPEYVFSLIDVYREGHDRVARLNASASWSSDSSPAKDGVELQSQYSALPTSNILASLTFFSGALRLHSNKAPRLRRRKPSRSTHDQFDDLLPDDGTEVFRLPVVSVWAEYRAMPAVHKLNPSHADAEPSTLMFKATIHSSENTLRPAILPFWADVVRHVEVRMRQASKSKSRQASRVFQDKDLTESQTAVVSETMSSMQISFSLRIDQSRLQLTCQPDVNVVAGLNWDSGGFMITVSPGARKVTFNGSVAGLTVGLKHGFLSEDCVRIDARNLAFTASFMKLEPGDENDSAVSFVSVVLDTEFSGLAKFSRLQDVLCFKAVWLDRIPVLHTSSASMTRKPSFSSHSSSAQLSQTSQNKLTTVVLVRVRRISLDVDLGQSISCISLDMTQGVLRTKLTEVVKELSLTVAGMSVTARGNVAGKMEVPNCVFQTTRREAVSGGKSRMLELSVTSGALTLTLESDREQLLRYHAEPLQIEVFDDWSMSTTALSPSLAQRPLQLSFLVSGTEITTMITIVAIPKLLSYMNKFKANLDAQRQGASFESTTFRVAQAPKPDNPLSAVANAMLHSARSRFKEVASGITGLDYVVTQRISLKLKLLRLVVFPRSIDDHEIAHFIGTDVTAVLDRVVGAEGFPPTRDLQLAFSSIVISKFSQLAAVPEGVDTRTWLDKLLASATKNVIAGLPSMTMHMLSEEDIQASATYTDKQSDGEEATPALKVLTYDFSSKVNHSTEGTKMTEDIYITLNFGLYNWLTVLRRSFAREMAQVRAVDDWRAASAGTGAASRASLLRSPEPGRSATATAENIAQKAIPPGSNATKSASLPNPAATPAITVGNVEAPQDSPPSNSAGHERRPSISLSIPENNLVYKPRNRNIERLTLRQLGDATPDVRHPFFMKTAGFNLEDSLPQYVNEYAITPLEEIMEVLLKVYTRQLLAGMGPGLKPT